MKQRKGDRFIFGLRRGWKIVLSPFSSPFLYQSMGLRKLGEYVIDDVFVSKVRGQFKIWALFLNNGIGLFSFTLGLACLGTATPAINASISILIMVLIRYQGRSYFPLEIETLRKEARSNEKARILLRGLETEFMGVTSIATQYPLFIIGFLFLVLVASQPILLTVFPQMPVGYWGG